MRPKDNESWCSETCDGVSVGELRWSLGDFCSWSHSTSSTSETLSSLNPSDGNWYYQGGCPHYHPVKTGHVYILCILCYNECEISEAQSGQQPARILSPQLFQQTTPYPLASSKAKFGVRAPIHHYSSVEEEICWQFAINPSLVGIVVALIDLADELHTKTM